ncbi:DUF4176 domain-containing protein [Leifsonia soli]|uniref:DUF4176 domain-containing protein n=1 Tax=Leifsonia soli TaxID=582665 RepID=A0A852SZM8_9MICO|nr:DUF4176 domain-containing protein [Leifsonia soli]NYD74716.1 hypothetical protein [Leifsonia soli]
MTLEMTEEFLGLGSIVRLGDDTGTGLHVVLARGAFRPDNARNEVVPRYLVGPHPYGEAPDRETFPVLATDIQGVVHHGYTDAADAGFLADLLDQMENGRRPITRARHFAEGLTTIPEASAVEESDAAARSRADPFHELRALVHPTGREGVT